MLWFLCFFYKSFVSISNHLIYLNHSKFWFCQGYINRKSVINAVEDTMYFIFVGCWYGTSICMWKKYSRERRLYRREAIFFLWKNLPESNFLGNTLLRVIFSADNILYSEYKQQHHFLKWGWEELWKINNNKTYHYQDQLKFSKILHKKRKWSYWFVLCSDEDNFRLSWLYSV